MSLQYSIFQVFENNMCTRVAPKLVAGQARNRVDVLALKNQSCTDVLERKVVIYVLV